MPKEENIQKIKAALQKEPLTEEEIAQKTGLNVIDVLDGLYQMEREGTVIPT